ncbi:MAG TPA: hypothetical protein PKD54_14220, partial [Pirellulaceae bacterium]|nr:hypothetical protein [Pirellulaceae bacterium]
MFQKMSAREKLLARLVGVLVPIMLLGWGGVWLSNRYFANRASIQRLRNQISQEENKKLDALLAQQRRFYYRDRSAPSDRNHLQVEYARWLTDTISKRAGMTLPAVVPQPNPTKGTYRGRRVNEVYNQYTFTANKVIGDIGQLLKFLEAFEELDLLHRISTLKIQPQMTGGGAGQVQTRTGKLVIDLTIDVMAMSDAETQRDFVAVKRDLGEQHAELVKQVASRNIFGLANNPPSLSARNTRFTAELPAATGETEEAETEVATPAATAKVSLLIDGEDIDEHDVLTWEVVASDLTDFTFVPEGRRRARFNAEQVPVGTYALTVRVTDNGFPQKSAERSFNIVVEPPATPRVVERPAQPPPPFKYAQTAYIVGSYETGGVAKCIIEIKPLQREHHLGIGESFELDAKTWTIRGIESREVVIQVGDELLTFKMGRTLDQPEFRYRTRT